jgi:hypothetical protein
MGLLVDGQWTDRWYDTSASGGRFQRQESAFRNWVTPDGTPGPTGEGGFKAEPGRYHLYVSLACPWVRALGIGVSGNSRHAHGSLLTPRWRKPDSNCRSHLLEGMEAAGARRRGEGAACRAFAFL